MASPSRDLPQISRSSGLASVLAKELLNGQQCNPVMGRVDTKNRSHEKILSTLLWMDAWTFFGQHQCSFINRSGSSALLCSCFRVLSFLISLRKVVCVRAEDINISGSLYRNKLKYANFRRKHMRLGCTSCSKVTRSDFTHHDTF